MMPISQTRSFLTDIVEGHPIPIGTLEYFRARLRSRLHQLVLDEFLRQEDQGLTKAELARRIGKGPDQVNRWLGAPGNWTLGTVSDLLLGMACEPELGVAHLQDRIAAYAQKWGSSGSEVSPDDLDEMSDERSS